MILSKNNFPPILPIGKIVLPEPEKLILKNGIPVYFFSGAKNNIISIELLFDAGRWAEKSPLMAKSCAAMLKSGTANKSAFEMADKIDFYGSTIKASVGYNTFSVQLFCLHRYLNESLPLLSEILNDVIFPDEEINLYKQNSLSQLKMNQEKTDFVADMAFKKLLFGDEHPYGYETTDDRINNINRNNIVDYYVNNICPEKCAIFISGNITPAIEKALEHYFKEIVWTKNKALPSAAFEIQASAEKKFYLEKKGAVQASLNIGKVLFNMSEPNYPEFLLANTILGGYFGSRLMTKIREEKGYTYGIHSGLQSLKHSGVFCIQTEIGVEHKTNCLADIYGELTKMCTDLVSEREITLARNYLLGKFLTRTDGPFNRTEQYKKYYIEGISVTKFEDFVEKIRLCNAKLVRNLCEQYLNPNTFTEVVVG